MPNFWGASEAEESAPELVWALKLSTNKGNVCMGPMFPEQAVVYAQKK